MADGVGEANTQGAGRENERPNTNTVMAILKRDLTTTILWALRLGTLVLSFLYVIPLTGAPYQSYYRAILGFGLINALRLRQRVQQNPPHGSILELLRSLLIEDSFHYLAYALLFYFAHPITFALVPTLVYSLLHASRFSKELLQASGAYGGIIQTLVSKLESNQQTLLRFIAMNEIILFPMIIVMLFSGQANLLMPYLYYQFLKARYASRRNTYTRQLFSELRVAAEALSAHARCPGVVRSFLLGSVRLISRLAPATEPAAEPTAQ